jgi:hypothetical protein
VGVSTVCCAPSNYYTLVLQRILEFLFGTSEANLAWQKNFVYLFTLKLELDVGFDSLDACFCVLFKFWLIQNPMHSIITF